MVDELGNAKGLYLSIPCHSPQPQTHKKTVQISQFERFVYTLSPFVLGSQRRERDSNPRKLALQRFSRPPHSTTLPSLHFVRIDFQERPSR